MGTSMIESMTMVRKTITMDAKLAAEAQEMAPDGNFSALVGELVAKHLRRAKLKKALDYWEEINGPIPEEEIDAAARELGYIE
jgi:hypothetical protein